MRDSRIRGKTKRYQGVSTFAALVFPQRCVVCGSPVSECSSPPIEPLSVRGSVFSAPVCGLCLAALRPISADRCRVCGVGLVSEEEICVRCRDRELSYGRHVSVFPYAGVAKELLIAYKFGGRRSLAAIFAPYLAATLLQYFVPPFSPAPVLVAVPPSHKGLRERGWDQVERLARELHRLEGIELADVLKRKGGREQKRLGFQGRSKNLLGTIRSRRAARRLIGRRVVLLDDVFTTGATINECARVLRASGVEHVDALTLAAD